MIPDAILNLFLSLIIFIRDLFPAAPDMSAFTEGYKKILGYMALFFDMRLLSIALRVVLVSLGVFVTIRLIRFIPGVG